MIGLEGFQERKISKLIRSIEESKKKSLENVIFGLGIPHIGYKTAIDLAKEFGDRLIGLRDGELVYDGKVDDVSDEDFENIYGRSIKQSDLIGND